MPKRKYSGNYSSSKKKLSYGRTPRKNFTPLSRQVAKLTKTVKKIDKSVEHTNAYTYLTSGNMVGNTENDQHLIGSLPTSIKGKKITATSHSVNLKFEYLAANNITYAKYRVLIVQPKAEVDLTLSDVLSNVSTANIFQCGYKTQDNNILDNKHYSVLMDKVFIQNSDRPMKIIKFRKKWKSGKVITLEETGGLLTASKDPNNYRPQILVYCMPNVNGTGASASYSAECKLRFSDL